MGGRREPHVESAGIKECIAVAWQGVGAGGGSISPEIKRFYFLFYLAERGEYIFELGSSGEIPLTASSFLKF